jgi:PAS domain S-box-containing protein
VNLREFNRILRQTLFLPVLLLLLLAGFIIWQISRSSAELRWIDHSDDVMEQTVRLEKLVVDQETGLRGYQLTGDNSMLTPYRAAAAPIARQFTTLRDLVTDNPTQLSHLANIRDRYQIWLGFAQGVLNKDPAVVNDPRLNQHGKELMDSLRNAVSTMLQTEGHLRRDCANAALSIERRELAAVLISSLLVGVLLAIFTRSRLRRVSTTYDAALEEVTSQAEEIYERRQWFQTTLESIGDAVIACDKDGNVEFMNAVAQELTGWTSQEALGRPLNEVFHIINEETRQAAENPVDKVRRLQTVVGLANHTALISRQEGKEYIIDDSAAPIRAEDGEMRGIVLVFRDVTENRRSEAALIAAEKLAVAGRLAASIAHEIHNPLDSVANVHFLLENETDPVKRGEYLRMAQQELGRTMQISRTLLSLYREPKAPVPVDLKDLAEGVLLLLERRVVQQNVTIEREITEPCIVEGFPAELRQVFTNVFLNALEAAGKGGRIRIRIEPVAAAELRPTGAMVEVADSGPGIPEQVKGNLFQPFFTTKGENGTGLGLWVSNGIVLKHGGSIRIANNDDGDLRGACVRVYLPTRTMANSSTRTTAHVDQGLGIRD